MVRGTPRHPGGVAISYDCSRIALALAEELRILDVTGTVVASMPLVVSPRDRRVMGYTRLAFSHGQRLIVAIDSSGMYLHDIVEGVVLACCETPEDAFKGLHDDARMRRSALGLAGDINLQFAHAVFTPDDSAVVALMSVRSAAGRSALYTVRWDLRWPAPLRISVLAHEMSLIPWSRPTDVIFQVEVDIDQNWGLYIRYNDYFGGHPSTCTIPRSDWDREDRGPDIAWPVTPLDHSFNIARDGWITEGVSNRRIGWLPARRRPEQPAMSLNVAVRGDLVVFVSESGVLTILNMSERS